MLAIRHWKGILKCNVRLSNMICLNTAVLKLWSKVFSIEILLSFFWTSHKRL